jgi:hypothetical protein
VGGRYLVVRPILPGFFWDHPLISLLSPLLWYCTVLVNQIRNPAPSAQVGPSSHSTGAAIPSAMVRVFSSSPTIPEKESAAAFPALVKQICQGGGRKWAVGTGQWALGTHHLTRLGSSPQFFAVCSCSLLIWGRVIYCAVRGRFQSSGRSVSSLRELTS